MKGGTACSQGSRCPPLDLRAVAKPSPTTASVVMEATPLPWSFTVAPDRDSGASLVAEVHRWAGPDGDLGRAVWSVLSGSSGEGSEFDLDDVLDRLRRWDRYQDLRLLGLGSGGAVFAAWDPRLHRDVALKFLWPRAYLHRSRALDEARAQAQVDHPHVVKIFETGEVLGLAYIAMQRVDGGSLASVLPKLRREQRLRLLVQVAEGVQAAHDRGMLHLDLKPANVLVDLRNPERPWALVADFGLARSSVGESRGAIGTPPFSSPEQLRGEAVSPASDVHALGVCLDSLLAEHPPFALELLKDWPRLAEAEPRPLAQRALNLDPALARLVAWAMAKDPAARPEHPRDFAAALSACLDGDGRALQHAARRGRRWRWTATAAALALALTALWGVRVRTRSARALTYQQTCQQVSRDFESRLRHLRTRPQHDVRPELGELRERLKGLEAQLATTPGEGQTAMHLALGKGHLALGDGERALPYLQWAWDQGDRTPTCAAALGLAHGEAYRRQLERYGPTVSPGLAKLRAEKLAVHGAAVQALLKDVQAGPGESSSYLAAVVASCGFRAGADTLRLARQARYEAPWLYEACLLEASAAHGLIMELQGGGDEAHVTELFNLGDTALDVAADLGRSDVRVPLHRVTLLTERVMRGLERGRVEIVWVAHLEEAIRTAHAIEDGPLVDAFELVASLQLIAYDRRMGVDSTPRIQRALTLGRALVGHPQHGLRSRILLGEVLQAEAQRVLAEGRSPLVLLDEADALVRGLVAEVGWTEADLAESHVLRCRALRVEGLDPTDFLIPNLKPFDQGMKDYAGDYGAPLTYARAWLECAQARLEQGSDPAEALERARPHVALARQQGGEAPGPAYVLAHLRMLEAWQAKGLGQDPALALREAEGQLLSVRKVQPERQDVSVMLAWTRWLRGDRAGATTLLKPIPQGHLLRRLHASLWSKLK